MSTDVYSLRKNNGNQLFEFCLFLSALPVLDICCRIKAWNSWPCKTVSLIERKCLSVWLNTENWPNRSIIMSRASTSGRRWWPGYASTWSWRVCSSSSFYWPLSSILWTFSRSRASPDCHISGSSLPRKRAIDFPISPWADVTWHRSHSAAYKKKKKGHECSVFHCFSFWNFKSLSKCMKERESKDIVHA